MTSIHLPHSETQVYCCNNVMPASLVIDIAHVHDAVGYAEYRAHVSNGLKAAGGQYLVRGGPVEVLEGSWQPGRVVVVQFDSTEAARRWWSSADDAALREQRHARQMVLPPPDRCPIGSAMREALVGITSGAVADHHNWLERMTPTARV